MAAETANGSSDLADLKAREEKALKLILQGVGKKKAIKASKLPYQPGDNNYRRVTRMAGENKDFFVTNRFFICHLIATDRMKEKQKLQKLKRMPKNIKAESLQRLRRCLNETESRLREAETKTNDAKSLADDLQIRLKQSENRF